MKANIPDLSDLFSDRNQDVRTTERYLEPTFGEVEGGGSGLPMVRETRRNRPIVGPQHDDWKVADWRADGGVDNGLFA